MGQGEFAFIERLRASLGVPRPGEVFVGDDAAVLLRPPGRVLFATDLVVEGVHFDPAISSPADVGWKAVAVNVSDIAAMGGRARHAVAAVSGPPQTDLDALSGAMVEAGASYGLELVGGDLSGGARVVVALAVLGDCAASGPVLRSGARAGDHIWLTGPVGASAAGLRILRRRRSGGGTSGEAAVATETSVRAHLRPVARPREGELAAAAGATAMIDVSDGLVADLGHLASASGVGVHIAEVPRGPDASEDDALYGGEDYELVFTIPAGVDPASYFAAEGLRAPLRIGECTPDPSERLLRGARLDPGGYEHRFGHRSGDR